MVIQSCAQITDKRSKNISRRFLQECTHKDIMKKEIVLGFFDWFDDGSFSCFVLWTTAGKSPEIKTPRR
jgi:hypothetical protein